MRQFVRNHQLNIALFTTLFIMMGITLWLGQAMFDFESGVPEAVSFWHWWLFITVLSLEADVFGAIILVNSKKWFPEINTPEARDPDD